MTPVDVLQQVLAGEHAAVYAYGVVGGQLAGSREEGAARNGFTTHRARRDAVIRLLRTAGAEPVAAAAAYDLGGPVVTPAQARALAARVERGVAAPYADLVAAADPPLRDTAARWLQDSAVRATSWSGTAEVWPGLTGRLG